MILSDPLTPASREAGVRGLILLKMHEFSISSEIVRTVLETAEKHHGKKVLSIQLEVGELTLLNLDQVTFWINALLKGSVAEGARVKIKVIKARIHCEACGKRGVNIPDQKDFFQHLIPLSCSKCGSPEIKVERGRECTLRRIRVER